MSKIELLVEYLNELNEESRVFILDCLSGTVFLYGIMVIKSSQTYSNRNTSTHNCSIPRVKGS